MGYEGPTPRDATGVVIVGREVVGAFCLSDFTAPPGATRLKWMGSTETAERNKLRVGTFIVRHAVAEARADGFEEILLSVRGTNERAIRLYTREGFRLTGKGNEQELEMRRTL